MSQLSIVMSIVCDHFEVTKIDMRSDRRSIKIARPRQVFCWVARHETGRSFPRIASAVSYGDHTSVMAAVKKVDELRLKSDTFRLETDRLRDRVRLALRGPTVSPDHEQMIENHLSVERARLKRLAVVDPVRFERRFGDLDAEAL